jgi:serine protease Do
MNRPYRPRGRRHRFDAGSSHPDRRSRRVGRIVNRVEPDAGATRAGIQQGDVIVKVAGEDVTPDNTLSFIVASQAIGAKVPIELWRRGQRITVTAVVGQRPSEDQLADTLKGQMPPPSPDHPNPTPQGAAARATLGVSLQALTPQIIQRLSLPATISGAVIVSVDPSSDAAAKGLKAGDVIVSVNQQPTPDISTIAAVLAAARRVGRTSVVLLVQRGSRPGVYVGVKLVR